MRIPLCVSWSGSWHFRPRGGIILYLCVHMHVCVCACAKNIGADGIKFPLAHFTPWGSCFSQYCLCVCVRVHMHVSV